MKHFIAAAFTLVGLVFTVGCVGAPDSDGVGGNVAGEDPGLEEQGCKFPAVKMPDCPPYYFIRCEFDPLRCSGHCVCVAN